MCNAHTAEVLQQCFPLSTASCKLVRPDAGISGTGWVCEVGRWLGCSLSLVCWSWARAGRQMTPESVLTWAGMDTFGWLESMGIWNRLGFQSKEGVLLSRCWRQALSHWLPCVRARGHAYVCAQPRDAERGRSLTHPAGCPRHRAQVPRSNGQSLHPAGWVPRSTGAQGARQQWLRVCPSGIPAIFLRAAC
jgi:hypothetical protein